METRREREQVRYKRGMASNTGQKAQKKAEELFTSTCLNLPKNAKLFQIKNDKPLRIDILPYLATKGNPFADPGTFPYERTYWAHKGVGPNNRTYPCPKENSKGQERCPICEERDKLREDPTADEDLIASLKPKRRQLFNIIDLNNREAGVQIWDISFHLFGIHLLEFLEDEEFAKERRDWCEFEGGKSLRLGLKEKTFEKRPFYEVTRIDLLDRKKDYDPEEMLKQVFCLDDVVKTVTYDELKDVFLQTENNEEETKTKHSFKEKDVKKINEMSEKELVRFILINEMEEDINPDDHDTVEDLRDAVLKEVKANLEDAEEEGSSKKKGKKESKDGDETENEIEVGSSVSWTDDEEDNKSGKVTKIKGSKATIEGDDDEDYIVALDELTLMTPEDEKEEEEEEEEEKKPKKKGKKEEEDEPAEVEEGSEVTWKDEDNDDHEGTVLEIKGKKAVVKEGKMKFNVLVKDLTVKED